MGEVRTSLSTDSTDCENGKKNSIPGGVSLHIHVYIVFNLLVLFWW
jgi:hypothetical protein